MRNPISKIAFREATYSSPGTGPVKRALSTLGVFAAVALPPAIISGLGAQSDAVTGHPAAFAEDFARQAPEGSVAIGSVGAGSPNSTSGIKDSKATEGLPKAEFSLSTGEVTNGEVSGTHIDAFVVSYPGSGEDSAACPDGPGVTVGPGIKGLAEGDTIELDGFSYCVAGLDEEGGYVGRILVDKPQDGNLAPAMTLAIAPNDTADQIIDEHKEETEQQLETISPKAIADRTERLWKDSSDSLFGLTQNLGTALGLLLVGGVTGFGAKGRRQTHNNLRLAGATRLQILKMELETAATTLIPASILGSAVMSRAIIYIANKQTLNLGADLSLSNVLTGLSATLVAGTVSSTIVAAKAARKANPRGEV